MDIVKSAGMPEAPPSLHDAATAGKYGSIKTLLQQEVSREDIHAAILQASRGSTAEHTKSLVLLLDQQPDLGICDDKNDRTVLHNCVAAGNLGSVHALARCGDLLKLFDKADKQGKWPLDLAFEEQSTSLAVAGCLLTHGFRFHMPLANVLTMVATACARMPSKHARQAAFIIRSLLLPHASKALQNVGLPQAALEETMRTVLDIGSANFMASVLDVVISNLTDLGGHYSLSIVLSKLTEQAIGKLDLLSEIVARLESLYCSHKASVKSNLANALLKAVDIGCVKSLTVVASLKPILSKLQKIQLVQLAANHTDETTSLLIFQQLLAVHDYKRLVLHADIHEHLPETSPGRRIFGTGRIHQSVLSLAVTRQHTQLIELLLDYEAGQFGPTIGAPMPLTLAAADGNLQAVELLLNRHPNSINQEVLIPQLPDVKLCSMFGSGPATITALGIAVLQKDRAMVEFLIKKGAGVVGIAADDANDRTNYLVLAVAMGCRETCALIVGLCPGSLVAFHKGVRPLVAAVAYNHYMIAAYHLYLFAGRLSLHRAISADEERSWFSFVDNIVADAVFNPFANISHDVLKMVLNWMVSLYNYGLGPAVELDAIRADLLSKQPVDAQNDPDWRSVINKLRRLSVSLGGLTEEEKLQEGESRLQQLFDELHPCLERLIDVSRKERNDCFEQLRDVLLEAVPMVPPCYDKAAKRLVNFGMQLYWVGRYHASKLEEARVDLLAQYIRWGRETTYLKEEASDIMVCEPEAKRNRTAE